jgi:hypothetical protein
MKPRGYSFSVDGEDAADTENAMARNDLAPALDWLEWLHEVGRPITRLAEEEAEVLGEIAGLYRQIEARKRDLAEIRAKAERRAAELWSEDEIAEAKARAKAERAA